MQHLHNELTEKIKSYIKQLGYSKTQHYQIPYCIKEFLQQVAKPNIKEISQQDILNFYEYLQSRPLKLRLGVLSHSMINHYVFSLKVFFNWLEQTNQIKYNPISSLKFKRLKPNTREPLSKQEIIQLFEATENSKEIAILHLFYSCGLRRTEAENLNTSDIHFTQNLLYVREGKGAKRRVIPITEKVKKELHHYFTTERKTNTAKDLEAFMFNTNYARMKGDQYNKILKQIVERTEINKVTTLHHLRHSIATHLLENGLSIEFVRDFLGHTHLEATQIYAKVFKHQLKKL